MRLLCALANMLDPEEREAVLGDLAEAGDSRAKALSGVLGLVVRRQASLWRNWRQWLIFVGFAIPVAVALHLVSRWDTGLIGNRALREDLPWFVMTIARSFASLACWSFLGGGVLRTLSPRTLMFQGPGLLFVMILAHSLDLMSHLTSVRAPVHHNSTDPSFYGALLPWLVQMLFVAIPFTWGLFQRLSRIVLIGVVVTVIELLCQLLLRPQLNYHLPALVMDCVIFWPFAYFAIRIASRWARVPGV